MKTSSTLSVHCGVGTGTAAGGDRRRQPRPVDQCRERLRAPPGADSGPQVHRRVVRLHAHDAGRADATGHGQREDDGGRTRRSRRIDGGSDIPIWARPPAWLYLPSQGWACGSRVDAVPRSGVDATRDAPAGHERGDEVRRPGTARDRLPGIRGRDEAPGPAARDVGRPAGIRGHGEMPGTARVGRRDLGRTRSGQRADDDGLQRYFDGIAERNAKRKNASDLDAGKLSAAERMAALRARVASRAAASDASRPPGGHGAVGCSTLPTGSTAMDNAAANAAAACAWHGRARGGAVDGCSQLSAV